MRWNECRSEADKRTALRTALIEHRTVAAAAKALGINRQYLYEVLPRFAPDMTDKPDSTVSVGSVGPTDSVGANGAVGPTNGRSLTYGLHGRSFRSVESAATMEMVRTAIDLPKSWLDWLEQEALRRKQLGLQPRSAKSPVVIEALEMLRQRIEREGREQ
jgi:hypothetical protein